MKKLTFKESNGDQSFVNNVVVRHEFNGLPEGALIQSITFKATDTCPGFTPRFFEEMPEGVEDKELEFDVKIEGEDAVYDLGGLQVEKTKKSIYMLAAERFPPILKYTILEQDSPILLKPREVCVRMARKA